MTKPYWYRLLEHYEKKRYFSNGLTIPFLIGSRILIEPGENLLSIGQFILEASGTPIPKPITIIKCGNIGEFVIGILDTETDAIRKQYSNLYKEIDNLIFTDSSLADISNLDSLS